MRAMRVLLLHLPLEYELVPEYTGDSLGLGYVAASLRRDGHEVEILDGLVRNLKPEEGVRETLLREFDCLGITANHYHHKELVATVQRVREQKPDTPIIVGGYLPTLSPEDLLKACPQIDIAVMGEGEVAISDLVGRIERGDDWRFVPGIAYMKDGMPVQNPNPPPVTDIDTLPFPARDGMLQAPADRPVKLVRILASRGCYHRCSFCCIHSFYTQAGILAPRLRNPVKVLDEIESTLALTAIKTFSFSDDDFVGPSQKTQQHAIEIAEELKKRKLPITFGIECRADVVREDILRQLMDVGLTEILLGIESGSQSQLDRYNKRTTVEQNRKAIETVRRLGLEMRTGFIAFDPYVTLDEFVENMQFLNETGIAGDVDKSTPGRVVHKATTRLVMFPGTPLVKRVEQDDLLIKKGLMLDYKFKDRRIRMMSAALTVLGFAGRLIKRIRGRPPIRNSRE